MQGLTVLEINEVPVRLLQHYACVRPDSTVAMLLANSLVMESRVCDVADHALYPSQTWASFNTGAPYALHGVHWYNDPKPDSYPLFWKILMDEGFDAGLVNSLHSSPTDQLVENRHLKFLIPDCFVTEPLTKPGYYRSFQELNLRATAGNSRASTLRMPLKESMLALLSLPRYGVRAKTIRECASVMSGIITKRGNRERLRNLQFPLVADMFLKQLDAHQPDVAVLFTNHVAANMHRYWYALFPEDYREPLYDDAWVRRYSGEIIAALNLLDRYLDLLVLHCRKHDRILITSSSMGQQANNALPGGIQQLQSHDFRLENVNAFVNSLTATRFNYEILPAMAPEYAIRLQTVDEARRCFAELTDIQTRLENIRLSVYLNETTVTLSAGLQADAPSYGVADKTYRHDQLGFIKFAVDDHHSGHHSPEGSLMIFNSRTAAASSKVIDYLEYAPAILAHFGVAPGDYMKVPSFSV